MEHVLNRKKGAEIQPGVGRWVSYLNRERKLNSLVGRRPVVPPAPKGLYIYGNVGSGTLLLIRSKSMQRILLCVLSYL